MRHTFLVLMLVLAIFGCSGQKAAELYEIAQFEELQNNQTHARELYEEIIKKYPESEYAKKAKERLSGLNKSTP